MPLTSKPLVSIGVACFNNEIYISQTLDSINNQTYSNIELIIIDDCSQDNSENIIKEWVKSCKYPYKFIKNTLNEGIPIVCNLIFSQINPKSKYFALIGDDIMETFRVENQVNQLEILGEEVGGVFSDMTVIDESNSLIYSSYIECIKETEQSITNFLKLNIEDKIAYQIEKNIVPAPAIMYTVNALKFTGKWDEDLYFEDWDLHLRMIKLGIKFKFFNEKIIKYRMLENSTFKKPNVLYYDSILKMAYKYHGISTKIETAINQKISYFAIIIYQLGGKNASVWLFRYFLIDKSLRNFVITLCCFLKLKYSTYEKFKKLKLV